MIGWLQHFTTQRFPSMTSIYKIMKRVLAGPYVAVILTEFSYAEHLHW